MAALIWFAPDFSAKKDPFHYETEGESEDIPGMPGYRFAEEEDPNEIGEDDLPF